MKKLLFILLIVLVAGCDNYGNIKDKPPERPLVIIEVNALGSIVRYKVIDANGNKYEQSTPYYNRSELLSIGDTLK